MAGNEPSNTFGPVESADETRQAQQGVANDAPVDINPNAVLARRQTHGIATVGDEFSACSSRRTIAADAAQHRRELLADRDLKTP